MPKTVTENARTIRAKDDATAVSLGMTDHRGREIQTGRNLLTFLNALYSVCGDTWPEYFYNDWKANRKDETK